MTTYSLNANTSPPDPRDYQAESIFPADLSLPKVYDPRSTMLQVRDQGSEGSCVAESISCLKEIQEKKNVSFNDYMSPQFVYNNRANQTTAGMNGRDAMNIVCDKGIVAEEDYPYGKIEAPDKISQDILNKAANYKAKGYAYVNTIDTMKSAIYRSGACIVLVEVYSMSETMWKPAKLGDPSSGGHAMAAIGWNEQGFILRNSWGAQWGQDGGYTIFPYSDWGMQDEVWTLIDDTSSQPDPKYSKWYWKTWRAIVNTWKNMNGMKYMLGATAIGAIPASIFDHWQISLVIPMILLGMVIASWWKKLYMAEG